MQSRRRSWDSGGIQRVPQAQHTEEAMRSRRGSVATNWRTTMSCSHVLNPGLLRGDGPSDHLSKDQQVVHGSMNRCYG